MSTTSGSFTDAADTITHGPLKRGENVTVSISGTYSMVIELQKATSSAQAAWKTVKSWSTANATVSYVHRVEEQEEVLRLFVRTDTSGTATVSLSDSVQDINEFKDAKGTAQMVYSDNGVEFPVGVLQRKAVGTAGTNCTVKEYGNGAFNTSVITLTNVDLPDIAGGANLAVGMLIYTLPAGKVSVLSSYMSVAIQQVDGNITADTPDVGLGTTIASGVVAVLGGTAAFENIMTGQTAADCDGTATAAAVATVLDIASGGDHTVYFNVADGWAASGEANGLVSGTVVLNWLYNDA